MIKITGLGAYLPQKRVSNADVSKFLDTSDAWIQERTGITQRYIAAEDQTTSDLATHAVLEALKHAGLKAGDIDGIICATSTPDLTLPSTAALVQHKTGLYRAFAYDMQAACAGFIYALSQAKHLLQGGIYKNIVVVGSEIFSRILDWQDRKTAVLFGDGAGAVVLSRSSESSISPSLFDVSLYSDGSLSSILRTTTGPSDGKTVGVLTMNGPEVYKYAIEKLTECSRTILARNKMSIEDVDWLVPHQANMRILESVSRRLGCPIHKVMHTIDLHANTSAASIPLALHHFWIQNKIKKEELILMNAIGAGMVWGACLFRW